MTAREGNPRRGLGAPTESKRERTERVVLDLLNDHAAEGALPTTIRFLFYELEQRGASVQAGPQRHTPEPPPERRLAAGVAGHNRRRYTAP